MIRLLEEIAEPGFGSAAFLTYGADLGFFESKVMNALQESGCRNVVVVADGHQAKDALNSAAELRYVGVHYPVVPIRLGNQAFHPKAILLVGEKKLKVLVGSGNLTLPGYTRNWEIFTKFEGEDAAGLALDLLRAFQNAADRSSLREAFAGWRRRLEKYSPWLFTTGAHRETMKLLCSSDGAILPRATKLLNGREVSRLLVLSPFFDRKATALRWIVDNVRPRELTLLATEGVQLDSALVNDALSSLGGGFIRRFAGDGRPLHGKALLFVGPWGEALLAGSPNLSSAALLKKAGAHGNFELASFQIGKEGQFSTLFEDKIGPPVDLEDLHPRQPAPRRNRVAPLELEAAWVYEGTLHVVPAGRPEKEPESIEIRLERRSAEIARHRLRKGDVEGYATQLSQQERVELEGAPFQACLVGDNGRLGDPVWVQNLDAVERRANPVQRPRYATGLQALSEDSLGLDEDAWNNLFEAFLALSKGWAQYAKTLKPHSPKRPDKPQDEEDQTWDPESFYVSLEDVRLELPAYFARVESSGWGIGDFEYLISALPTAGRLGPPEPASGNLDGTPAPPEDDEGADSEETGDEDDKEDGDEIEGTEPESPEASDEQRRRISNRLFKKFERLVGAYEESVAQTPQTTAEATLLCLLYTALHVALARAASARLLDASRFRDLGSWLTAAWTADVWKLMQPDIRNEVEDDTGCATISLTVVAAATSLWAREEAEVWDEFDADLYVALAESLRELRPAFRDLKANLEAGQVHDRWTKAVGEYARLDPARATPLSRFQDLERRYEVWLLNEKSALLRALEKWEIADVADLENGVLRIHARLPHSMHRQDLLGKLLYMIHEGVETSAALVWENAQHIDTIRRIALILDPEQKAVLEVTRYAKGGFLLRRHSARGGTATGGVSLMNARSIPSTQLHLVKGNSSDATLIERARELVPDVFER